MDNLPRPAFTTDEEIVLGGKAVAQSGDTTKGNIEKAIPLGELILNSGFAHVRFLRKEDTLVYHVFRGDNVPDDFWGRGEYGLVLLSVAESYWPVDKPSVQYYSETCRQEVYEDDIKGPPKFPKHYYGAYTIVVPGIDRKFNLTDEKIKNMGSRLEEALEDSASAWNQRS